MACLLSHWVLVMHLCTPDAAFLCHQNLLSLPPGCRVPQQQRHLHDGERKAWGPYTSHRRSFPRALASAWGMATAADVSQAGCHPCEAYMPDTALATRLNPVRPATAMERRHAEANLLSCRRPHAYSHSAGAHLGAQGPRVVEQLVQHALQLHACAVPNPLRLCCSLSAAQCHHGPSTLLGSLFLSFLCT